MKIKIFPLTADATLALRRRRVMKLQRKHKMPEICSWLIVAAAAASVTWLTLCRSLVAAQDDDDSEMHQHHMDLLHHQQQHTDFIIGESEEHDHIAHHLAEMQNHEELLEDIREDTAVNAIPDKDLPKFGELLQNVTIPVGREAVLQCVVDNLQTYKIAWLRVDTQTILTIQNHVITKNHRMSITHAEKRAWILRIRDVKESDKGWYMCQINTDPMKSQVGYLDVVVPPDILDYPTSTDMVIREGSNVTLKCAATGSPTPTITWRREGGELIPLPNGAEAIAYNGSFLTIAKVNRLNMGAYLCIASNGIPPTVSKRVMLIVHCERFVPETFESGYKITMRLTIYDVDISDFGAYRCVAKNSLGDTDGAIKLYHIPQTTTITTMAPTVSINTVPVVIVKYNKEQRYSSNSNSNSNNPYNYNNQQNNNKAQRPKSKTIDQPPSSLNTVYMGATSSLWNSQDHHSQATGRGRDHQQQQQQHLQPQHHAPDHSATYRADGKNTALKHDAKSLTDEMDRMQDLKSKAMTPISFSPLFMASAVTLSLVYLGTWPV
ncbi:peroxidasin isoform X2 [Drosophila nasuta]|uniref:peroxidasin isoform X2 n=1 Tax=Drosophila nasuta TaxID=42062 RepID=UPI00295EBDFA|nr:peroxidasin isoform X2 [Drosophila nasuta]